MEEEPRQVNHESIQTNQSHTLGMVCHLISLIAYIGIPFGNIAGPLVIWLVKKDEDAFVGAHGKESLNFQISLTIYAIISGLLCFVVVGFVLLAILFILNIVLVIIASVEANKGNLYRYPLTIRLIK